MKNYKKILISAWFLIIISMVISSVSAITPEEQAEGKKLISTLEWESLKEDPVIVLSVTQSLKNNYSYKLVKVKTSTTYPSANQIVKKDGTYQRKAKVLNYVTLYNFDFRKGLNSTQYQFYGYTDSINNKLVGYKYEPAKKGDRLKIYDSSTKTSYQKGIIYEIKPYILYEVINPNKAKKIKSGSIKTIVGYYKTYKMPTLSSGKYKNGYFKGENFTYGNSIEGYYVTPKNNYTSIYKITPSNKIFPGKYLFYKKPSSFTIYVNR